jgi:hypothetical protein
LDRKSIFDERDYNSDIETDSTTTSQKIINFAQNNKNIEKVLNDFYIAILFAIY